MGFIIVGVILVLIGLVLWFSKKKNEGKLNTLATHDTSKVNDIVENFESLSTSFGPGNFSLFTKINGVAFANTPVESEFSKKPCVYYKSTVTREYEELETTKDAKGDTVKKWVQKSDVVSENSNKSHDFALKDETGEILIDIASAELHPLKTFSTFEQGSDPGSGGMKISISGFTLSSGTNIRTIGFKYEEESIPLNTKLFVVGDANDRSGRLSVSKPKEKNPFIVSTKSEDEITGNLNSSVKGMTFGFYGTLIAGGIAIVYGIITLFLN